MIEKMSDVGCISLADVIDGQLRFGHDNLATFFESEMFKDKPICIVAIAGAMRTGKSFMLNFFQRYLDSKGWENSNWIEDDQRSAVDRFHWRCGKDPDTKGINVWGRPYLVRRSDGQEVAVVLMDTQGLFDHDTNKENNAKLFTLSVLASSIQILNIKELIQERDLENLHFCVEFGRTALKKKCSDHMQLQSLQVLIRDWMNDHEAPHGFNGGKSYLDGVLAQKKDVPELNKVRKFLRETFKDLECFLMPHPGLKAVKNNFEGGNAEIQKDFLNEVQNFCESNLHPDKLVIKMSGNRPMSARKLANTLAACDEIFAGGELPLVETLVEVFAKAHYETASRDCIDLYEEKMQVLKEKSLPDSDLDRKHQQCQTECLEEFRRLTSKYGEMAVSFEEELKMKIKYCYISNRNENERNRKMEEQLKNNSQELTFHKLKERLCFKFTEKLQQIKQAMATDELEEKLSVLKDDIFKEFQTEKRDVGEDLTQKYKQLLDDKLAQECIGMRQRNQDRLNILEEKFQIMSDKLEAEYKKKMLMGMEDSYFSPEALETLHKEVADRLLKYISTKLQNMSNEMRTRFTDDSANVLHKAFEEIKNLNEKIKKTGI